MGLVARPQGAPLFPATPRVGRGLGAGPAGSGRVSLPRLESALANCKLIGERSLLRPDVKGPASSGLQGHKFQQ